MTSPKTNETVVACTVCGKDIPEGEGALSYSYGNAYDCAQCHDERLMREARERVRSGREAKLFAEVILDVVKRHWDVKSFNSGSSYTGSSVVFEHDGHRYTLSLREEPEE